MGAGTVIFEGVRRKPKRNRGPQKARSIAEISILLVTLHKNCAHNIMYIEQQTGTWISSLSGTGSNNQLILETRGGQVLPC
jgi:hypothetical protein